MEKREQVARAIAQVREGGWPADTYYLLQQHYLTMADAAIAALEPVKVKPLVWGSLCARVFEDGSGQIHCKADGRFGLRYAVYQTPSEGIYASCSHDSWASHGNSVEAAKAAAQADYEARILAAIEPAPVSVQPRASASPDHSWEPVNPLAARTGEELRRAIAEGKE